VRKFILVVMLALCALSAHAQFDFLKVNYSLEMQWLPAGYFWGYTYDANHVYSGGIDYTYVIPDENSWYNTFRSVLSLEGVFFKNWFIGTSIGTTMSVQSDVNYIIQGNPFFTDYVIRFGFRADHVEIGFERFCAHPIIANTHAKFIRELSGEGSFGKVYLKIGGSL
jgi:hypothetical protein